MTTDEKLAILKTYGRLRYGEYHSVNTFYVRLDRRDTTNTFLDFYTLLSECVSGTLRQSVDIVYERVHSEMWGKTLPNDAGFFYCPYVPIMRNM